MVAQSNFRQRASQIALTNRVGRGIFRNVRFV